LVTERYFNEFEEKGERKVREELGLGIYNDPRRKYAVHWLAELDRASREATDAEHLRLAREAANAAKEANQIAKSARNTAISAIVISIVVSLVSTLL